MVTPDPEARAQGIATAVERLAELSAIVHQHGRPWRVTSTAEAAAAAYPEAWYADWN